MGRFGTELDVILKNVATWKPGIEEGSNWTQVLKGCVLQHTRV
jgi:hypothetical protein